MNLAKRRAGWLLIEMVLACAVMGPAAYGGGADTAFTYQGQLKESGAPANGLHDFRFRLFDAASGDAQVGQTLCVDNVDVVNGLFTLPLDFGQQYATTAQRHLEVQVRREIGQPCTDNFGYVLLSPRQQITATPMASHANDAFHADAAFALDAADGSPASAVFVDNGGNVGIGTTNPAAALHVNTSGEGLRIQGPAVGAANGAWVEFRDSVGTRIGYVGDGSGGDSSMYVTSDAGDIHLYTAVGAALSATSAGNVGVGTTTPAAKLDVRGDIKLGSSGQFFASSGEENLRIVRGKVVENGPDVGSGFSVSHPGIGDYNITFNPPFAAPPVVTASVDWSGGFFAYAMTEVHSASSTSVHVLRSRDDPPQFVDSTFHFIAIGPR